MKVEDVVHSAYKAELRMMITASEEETQGAEE